MAYDDPNIERDHSGSRKTIFAAMLIVLGVLVFMMIRNIQHLPPVTKTVLQDTSVQSSSSEPPAPVQDITLGFRVGGRVAQMFFADNAEVKKGDLLATLDRAPFEQALASANAQMQVAQSSVHAPMHNFSAIEAARANVEDAQHTYDGAREELDKRRKLIVAGVQDNVYADDVEDARDAQLNLERARRELAQQEDIGGNTVDRDSDKAAVALAQANVAVAESNLADTQLTAPASGTIASHAVEVGATISPGATIYTIAPAGN